MTELIGLGLYIIVGLGTTFFFARAVLNFEVEDSLPSVGDKFFALFIGLLLSTFWIGTLPAFLLFLIFSKFLKSDSEIQKEKNDRAYETEEKLHEAEKIIAEYDRLRGKEGKV